MSGQVEGTRLVCAMIKISISIIYHVMDILQCKDITDRT